jgi:neurofibromin 1
LFYRSANRTQSERFAGADRSFAMSPPDREPLSLDSLADITEALLEIMEHCAASVPCCNWLQQWTALAKSFAFRYNPALQPRGLVVFGCIAKSITDHDVKQLLRHLVKALESFSDITLIEAIVMCLTRLQPLLRRESPIHMALFWVAISILQLDESSLYASGLAFLEQNLLTLESHGTFDQEPIDSVMMSTREALEWYFKQQDHSVGLSFKNNFHFALVGHLIKGYRHPSASTVSRTTRVMSLLLDIVGKSSGKDKYEVSKHNVAYLAGLVSVSEEVRSRCHVKHTFTSTIPDSPTFNSFAVDAHHLKTGCSMKRPPTMNEHYSPHSNAHQLLQQPAANQRQKSLDQYMDQQSVAANNDKLQKQAAGAAGSGSKLDKRSSSGGSSQDTNGDDSQIGQPRNENKMTSLNSNQSDEDTATRPSISEDNNILLDPEVLNDQV